MTSALRQNQTIAEERSQPLLDSGRDFNVVAASEDLTVGFWCERHKLFFAEKSEISHETRPRLCISACIRVFPFLCKYTPR
jgi:hypothetical protein